MTEQNTNIQATEAENVGTEKIPAVLTAGELTAGKLTAKEIFDQIVALQNLLADVCTNPLHSLNQSVHSICESGWESCEEKKAAIDSVAGAFRMREETYRKMLEMYQQMYEDLSPRKERNEFYSWVRDCIVASDLGIDLLDFAEFWKAMT